MDDLTLVKLRRDAELIRQAAPKDRLAIYNQLRKKHGLPNTEPKRKVICEHLGLGTNTTVKVVCCGGIDKLHTVHSCPIHKRCIPTYPGPWDKDHSLEAELFTLCHQCPDHTSHSNEQSEPPTDKLLEQQNKTVRRSTKRKDKVKQQEDRQDYS